MRTNRKSSSRLQWAGFPYPHSDYLASLSPLFFRSYISPLLPCPVTSAPEDGVILFLRNVGIDLWIYMAPETKTSTRRFEILICVVDQRKTWTENNTKIHRAHMGTIAACSQCFLLGCALHFCACLHSTDLLDPGKLRKGIYRRGRQTWVRTTKAWGGWGSDTTVVQFVSSNTSCRPVVNSLWHQKFELMRGIHRYLASTSCLLIKCS
jgi:hypothetical protein